MIDIYITWMDQYSKEQIQSYEALLSSEEIIAKNKFVFEKDQLQNLLTRAMLRQVLAKQLNCAPSDLVFEKWESYFIYFAFHL